MNKSENAFTLLELIIALSIGAALILIVSLSVKMGFSHMERGTSWIDESHREKSAIQFFNQQVSSMVNKVIEDAVVFQGSPDKLLFVTPISLEKRYGLGLMSVLYYVETGDEGVDLLYKEKRFVPDKNTDKFKDESNLMFDSSESVKIFSGCDEAFFEFLDVQGPEIDFTTKEVIESEWKEIWKKNNLPKAVKLTVLKNGQTREIVAPIMVLY